MQDMQAKLENPARLAELNPEYTLRRIGLNDGDALCDIGAGSGIFTIPAARLTRGMVYAIELRADMLNIIAEKARAASLDNVVPMLSDGASYAVADGAADIALAVTVLHEIADKAAFLKEVKRLLKPGGRMAVIEFHKRETPMGPPVARRLSKEDVGAVFADAGFATCDAFDLGDNFYCMVFEVQ